MGAAKHVQLALAEPMPIFVDESFREQEFPGRKFSEKTSKSKQGENCF